MIKRSRCHTRALAVLALSLLVSALSAFDPLPGALSDAAARPGGGQGFSGGSRSSGSGSSGSGSSGSRSSGGSSWSSGGSSRSGGSSDSSDSSWSKTPSYSAPWSSPEPEKPRTSSPSKGRNPHGGNYAPRAPMRRPSGAVISYFFWIFVGIVGFAAALKLGAYLINRRLEDWVEDGRRDTGEWQSGLFEHVPVLERAPPEAVEQRYASVRDALEALRAKDPDYSFVVFEDFLYALYAAVHAARGTNQVDLFAPYLGADARAWLQGRPAQAVTAIIIGAMRVEHVAIDQGQRRVLVELVFTANYSERHDGEERSYFVEERWHVSRGADVLSRAPEKARVIGCPNCGANLDQAIAGSCKYCKAEVTNGDFDWRIDRIDELTREERGPILTGTSAEVGTDDATQVADDAKVAYAAIQARDPAFHWDGFVARVEAIFAQFHESWSTQDLKGVRPYLSDALFDVQRYWVETYKAQKLRNITEQRQLLTVHLARVVRDAHFESITARVFASCVDYTVDAAGDVVGGDKGARRNYSEYWTLIRSARASGAARATADCPNCGAPATAINMAGKCESCGVKITLGAFDWVLSRIEQDEVFRL